MKKINEEDFKLEELEEFRDQQLAKERKEIFELQEEVKKAESQFASKKNTLDEEIELLRAQLGGLENEKKAADEENARLKVCCHFDTQYCILYYMVYIDYIIYVKFKACLASLNDDLDDRFVEIEIETSELNRRRDIFQANEKTIAELKEKHQKDQDEFDLLKAENNELDEQLQRQLKFIGTGTYTLIG